MRAVLKAEIALTVLLASTLFAMSDDMPKLNVQPICRGIAQQAAERSEKGGPDLKFNECLKSEQGIGTELAKTWSTFAPGDRGHCMRLAMTGGESSYTELITCLEMARDVRKLHTGNIKAID